MVVNLVRPTLSIDLIRCMTTGCLVQLKILHAPTRRVFPFYLMHEDNGTSDQITDHTLKQTVCILTK